MQPELCRILAELDYFPSPMFAFDDLAVWPEGAIDRLVAAGLLQPAEPAEEVFCSVCGVMHDVVSLRDSQTQKLHWYARCPEVGLDAISTARLGQWRVSLSAFLKAVFAPIALSGEVEELVRDRVWKMGHAYWAGAIRHVYFARGLHCHDVREVMTQANWSTRSIVFVPAKLPTKTEDTPIVLPLTSYLSFESNGLQFARDFVESEIATAVKRLDEIDSERPQRTKRGSRVSVIEGLIQELKDHLRAARDHAIDTQDRLGEPQLLPRPQRDFLARKLGVTKSQVTRAFQDDSAQELCFLWDVAADLERILGCASPGR